MPTLRRSGGSEDAAAASIDISVASASIDVQNMNLVGVVSISKSFDEGDWAFNAASQSYNFEGEATYIDIHTHVHQQIPNASNFPRPAPVLTLEFSDDGIIWTVLAISATGYIRDTSDHEQSSNSLFHRDIAPAYGRRYRLSKSVDTTITGATESTIGSLNLTAVTKEG